MKFLEEIKNRYTSYKEMRAYELKKSKELLWVSEQEDLDNILGTDYAKDLKKGTNSE
tara:strand:- start:1347 stop:1517 length:171 start_codon:yes stop_codon:yes gene_type:complete